LELVPPPALLTLSLHDALPISLLLAIILIFLILASQFESYTQPLAIMVSLPLSLVGVLLALLITDDTLNMMSMIGVIMLMGLVTDRKSTRLNSSHVKISYAVFC